MNKVLVLIIFLLPVGCRAAPQQTVTAANVVGTMVAHTLEAYVPPTMEPTATSEPDPAEGPSIVVTQAQAAASMDTTPSSVEIPLSHYIWDIWGHRQYFGLGCEASAVVDWAEYLEVTVSEFTFQVRLPFSDNPDLGFVGSVDGPWGQVPPYAYGVHAAPVAKVLREHYGMNAAGEKELTIEDLQRELASGQPVIAWVIGNCVGGIPYEYIDKEGTPVIVAAYEHVVILTGYDEDSIRYMNNGKFYDIPYENFANTWGVLGNMALYLAD